MVPQNTNYPKLGGMPAQGGRSMSQNLAATDKVPIIICEKAPNKVTQPNKNKKGMSGYEALSTTTAGSFVESSYLPVLLQYSNTSIILLVSSYSYS